MKYFESAGEAADRQHCVGVNPATWILDVIGAGVEGALLRAQAKSHPEDAQKLVDYAALYKASPLYNLQMDELSLLNDREASPVIVDVHEYQKPSHKLLWALLKRSMMSAWRDSHTNFGRIAAMLFLGCAFGLLFLQIDDSDYAGVNSKLNAIFYVITLGGIAQCFLAVPTVVHQRAVVAREQSSNAYPKWCYAVCLTVVDIPCIAIATMALVLPCYMMIGFNYDAQDFFRFYVAMLLGMLVLASFGQCVGATFRSYVISMSVTSTMILFFFYSVQDLHPNEIPEGWLWFFYLSPVPRSLFACAVDQFRCDTDKPYTNTAECPSIDVLVDDGTTARVTTHAHMNSILEVDI